MIRELEENVPAHPLIVPASKDATDAGDKAEAQVTLEVEHPNTETRADVDKDQPTLEAEPSSKKSPPITDTYVVDAEKAKDRSNKLALYKRLLDAAKTESASSNVDALASKNTDKSPRAPDSPGRASQIPDEATPMLATSSSPAAPSKPSDTLTVDAPADISIPADMDKLPTESSAHEESQPSVNSISPSIATANQDKSHDQAQEAPVPEPVFVKSEPVDIDFTIATPAANPPVTADPGVNAAIGDEQDNHGADSTTYSNENNHALQPAETSMEEDPLLAELFPTFPMGDSPAQANHMQAEEESDPMLAGMLQEVS